MLANTICLVAQSQTLMAGGLLLVSLSYSGELRLNLMVLYPFLSASRLVLESLRILILTQQITLKPAQLQDFQTLIFM